MLWFDQHNRQVYFSVGRCVNSRSGTRSNIDAGTESRPYSTLRPPLTSDVTFLGGDLSQAIHPSGSIPKTMRATAKHHKTNTRPRRGGYLYKATAKHHKTNTRPRRGGYLYQCSKSGVDIKIAYGACFDPLSSY
ncbi:hypothetical protein J6590_045253 [Homalodisca vitripennis]|nr:hypothetical protein J6590_045253 [Homalodisca vitripennis]